MLAAAYLDWLYNALGNVLAFFYALIPSYGVAIILLTITVRVLLIPLTAKQVKSQRAMQLLQPELKKLQAKYKGDRLKLNEEMMKLYKEHKANPLAGCLPLILQMPLFIVLYRIIRSLSEVPPKHIPLGSSLHHALAESAGKLESFGIDLAHKPQSVLALFLVAAVVASGYYQQKQMTARMSKDAINPQMQMITKIMPAFFGLISLSVPTGVVLYFITSNIWQIGQQAVAFRTRPVPVGEADGEPEPKSGSGGSGAGTAVGGGPNAKGGGGKSGNASVGGKSAGGGSGSAKGGGGAGGSTKNGGSGSAKSGGGGGAAKSGGGSGKNVPAKAATPKKPGGGGSSGGGSTRPPSGRVTPKGGGRGRVTPKGGPGGTKAGSGAGSGSGAGAGQKAGKASSKSGTASSAGTSSSAGKQSRAGESLMSRLQNRAAKAKRPPPAARPKGLPPTKGSSGGSSRKES
jgi:YidC/Oxa1 family membrane protein insertase